LCLAEHAENVDSTDTVTSLGWLFSQGLNHLIKVLRKAVAVVLIIEPYTENAGLASLIEEKGLFNLEVETWFDGLDQIIGVESVHDYESVRGLRVSAVQKQGAFYFRLLPLSLVIVETVKCYMGGCV